MTVEINGKRQDVGQGPRKLVDVLSQLGYSTDFAAVAVNFECIPRGELSRVELHDDDRVEVLSPHQGG